MENSSPETLDAGAANAYSAHVQEVQEAQAWQGLSMALSVYKGEIICGPTVHPLPVAQPGGKRRQQQQQQQDWTVTMSAVNDQKSDSIPLTVKFTDTEEPFDSRLNFGTSPKRCSMCGGYLFRWLLLPSHENEEYPDGSHIWCLNCVFDLLRTEEVEYLTLGSGNNTGDSKEGGDQVATLVQASHEGTITATNAVLESARYEALRNSAIIGLIQDNIAPLLAGNYMPTPQAILDRLYPRESDIERRMKSLELEHGDDLYF